MPYATPLTSPTVSVPFATSTSNPSSAFSSPDRPPLGPSSESSSSSSSLSSSTTTNSPFIPTPTMNPALSTFPTVVEPDVEGSPGSPAANLTLFAQGRKRNANDRAGDVGGVGSRDRDGLPGDGLDKLKGKTAHIENGLGKLSIADMREAYYGKSQKPATVSNGMSPALPLHRYLDSLITVQPPTPDRGLDERPSGLLPNDTGDITPTASRMPTPTSSALSNPSTLSSSSTASDSTITDAPPHASTTNRHSRNGSGSLHNLMVNSQMLPSVRSPPRNTSMLGLGIGQQAEEDARMMERSSFSSSLLSDASSVGTDAGVFDHVDSLQLNPKRGRRKLFGFTEMSPDSGSSSASNSRDGSRDNSPARGLKGGLEITSMRYVKKESVKGTSTPQGSLSPPTPGSRSPLVHHDSHSYSAPATPAYPQQTMPRRHPASRNGSSTFLATQVRPTPVSPRLPARPAGLSTRTSAQRNEGALKLDLQSIRPSVSGPASPVGTPGSLIRKKSGELVKPSLKSSSSYSDVTDMGPPSTRSLPSTPGFGKNVHFDTQLERVKLFLHDQKPQIVSRDGSPNEYYTTSEGEGEYPFPTVDDDSSPGKRTQLEIELPNFPTYHSEHADLYMESITLDEDRKSIRGIVRVRNISFQKWVAVRFTFDWWQTTSEVTATHKDSLPGGQFDRFTFTVKLHDILAKIEEKTLFIALRYNTDGREIWDSNNGSNYQVTFTKVPVATRRLAGARSSVSAASGRAAAKNAQWDASSGKQDRMADLRAKLNKLSDDERASNTVELNRRPTGSPKKFGSYGARKLGDINGGMELDIAKARESPGAGITSPLAARYDFGTSMHSSRGGKMGASPDGRRRELSAENLGGLQFNTNAATGPSTEFYSPQTAKFDLPSGLPSRKTPQETAKAAMSGSNRLEMPPPNLRIQEPSPPADYFTPAAPRGVIAPITKPAANGPTTSLPSMYSAPPFQMSEFVYEQNGRGQTSREHDVETSPPSVSSSYSSNSDIASPISPHPEIALPEWSPHKTLSLDDFGKLSYSSILEQFCWGGSPQQHPALADRRAASTTSVDRFYADSAGGVGHDRNSSSGSGFNTPSAAEMTPTTSGYGFSRYSSGNTSSNPVPIQKRGAGSCTPSPGDTPLSSPTRTLRQCMA